MPKHFFVLGLDPLRRSYLESVQGAEDYIFHPLLDYDEAVLAEQFCYDALLHKAERQLRSFPEPVAGILGHWDFPSSVLIPHLCQRNGLRSASLRAILTCEHKYWCRLAQRAIASEWTPAFCAVDPFAPDPLAQVSVDYPFWLKPAKCHSSCLGFRIDSAADFRYAIDKIRAGIRRYGDAFNQALAYIDLPAELGSVNGNWCIAEEIITGKQCGIEGSMLNGDYRVHGIVDTVKDSEALSFTRYEYPSVWPESAQRKICAMGERLLRHIGLDNSPFGIEFFWDQQKNAFRILEINTRISQSHSDQFLKVHGVSNHQVVVDLALNRPTDFSLLEGPYRCAAKFMLRRYQDARVERTPTVAEIRAAETSVADSKILLSVRPGQQLSNQLHQDSYSYEIADILLGARNQQSLLDDYLRLVEQLHFEFSDGQVPESIQFNRVRY